MEKNYCSKCGEEIDIKKNYCSKCGEKVNENSIMLNKREQKEKNKKYISEIIRYIFGVLFCLGGISNIISGYWYGLAEFMFGISLMPFVYEELLNKFVKNVKKLKDLQAILPIVLFTMTFLIINVTDDQNNNFTPSIDRSSQTTTKVEKKELTESDKMTLKLASLMNEKLAFDSGTYIKGEVPAGEYAFIRYSGSGQYYSEEDSAGNIIDNENFDSFGYVKVHAAGNLKTRGVLVNISAFEKLNVTGAKQLYEILNNQSDYHEGGYYKVGVDIPAGQYVLESYGSGYWAIMSGPVGKNEIVKNDNFNGKATVNVRDGQYLTISRSTYTKQ